LFSIQFHFEYDGIYPITTLEDKSKARKDFEGALNSRKRTQNNVFDAIGRYHSYITQINTIPETPTLFLHSMSASETRIENIRKHFENIAQLQHQLNSSTVPLRVTQVLGFQTSVKILDKLIRDFQTDLIIADSKFTQNYYDLFIAPGTQ